jgi:hemoglobin
VPEPPTLFDQLGGEPALRRVIDRFIDRVFADAMVGFMFANADRQRIKDKEFEFAAQHLGAAVEYSGRPLDVAHRAHRIFDGQFSRRLTILRETLEELGVPERVRQHWLGHTEALRSSLVIAACNAELPHDRAR